MSGEFTTETGCKVTVAPAYFAGDPVIPPNVDQIVVVWVDDGEVEAMYVGAMYVDETRHSIRMASLMLTDEERKKFIFALGGVVPAPETQEEEKK